MNNLPSNSFNFQQRLAMMRTNLTGNSVQNNNSAQANYRLFNIQNSLNQINQQIQSQNANASPAQNFLNQNIQETLLNNAMLFEKTSLNNQEILKYLQTSMKMPASIDEFLQETVYKQIGESSIEKFLNFLLDTKVLNELLNKNSKAAADRMILTIANSIKTGGSDVQQLKEMLSVLTSVRHNTTSDTGTLRELLLLYIPLNYLVFDLKNEYNQVIEDEDEKIQNSTLSILFETIQFSNMLCCVTNENNDILIEMYGNDTFPYEEFQRVVHALAKEALLNIRFDYIKINTAAQNSTKQNFQVTSSEFIPSKVLLTAHMLIRMVFKFDDNYNINAK